MRHGAFDIGALEKAHFVKNIEVRQEMLARTRHDLSAAQGEIGVIKPLIFDHRRADGQRRTIGAVPGQPQQMNHCISHKGGFRDQVLCLIAGQKHLGQGDKICPGRLAFCPGCARLFGVACDIPHGGI